MSIYATNYVVDLETGEPHLIKHLNKRKAIKYNLGTRIRGWNKSGKKARKKKHL